VLALAGVHMSLLAQLMGHADPKTTAIYTRVASQQQIAALDEAGLL
jgi:site-specific recombinase XerD